MLRGKSGKRCVSVSRCRLQDPENTREFAGKMHTGNETGLGGGAVRRIRTRLALDSNAALYATQS